MLLFLGVWSCSMHSSMLVGGVVVEQHQQTFQDDYYESANIEKYLCTDTRWGPPASPEKDDNKFGSADQRTAFRFELSRTAAKAAMVTFLKDFLFVRTGPDTIPAMWDNLVPEVTSLQGLGSCKDKNNWVATNKTDMRNESGTYQCENCGYNVPDELRNDIITFMKKGTGIGEGAAAIGLGDIPKTWCHNPLPVSERISPQWWAETGGYYNVLRCLSTRYSTIGFAAERKDTCYPYHQHKSYEMYWPLGGNGIWKPDRPQHPGFNESYTAKYNVSLPVSNTYFLHKHDPMVAHEISTTDKHTVQIYLWSMTGTDEFDTDINSYDASVARGAEDRTNPNDYNTHFEQAKGVWRTQEDKWQQVNGGTTSGESCFWSSFKVTGRTHKDTATQSPTDHTDMT